MEQQTNNNSQQGNRTLMAFLAYIVFFIPLLTDSKNDPFVKFHVKQGLVLLIATFLVNIIARVFFFSMFGSLYYIIDLAYIALLVLWIIGITNVFSGKEKELPLIGQFASKFKI